ncbi:MAG: peptide chain release factor 1 [Acidiferrobacteraceae bacterium]|nr:peptide chain release factor 1 [Acidiferrobacteraceae bacterium]|tara:strand:- start:5970 stop:7055 length:1086 start_codon:yes stop_codon:yes gene_type:complete
MNQALKNKLQKLHDRVDELNQLLADPKIISDQQMFRKLSIELAEVEPIVNQYQIHEELALEINEAEIMLSDEDLSIRKLARDEVPRLKSRIEENEKSLQLLLLPKDPNDRKNVYLEIRAGTGGDEAALFAGDLFRMYNSFSEKQGWKIEVTSHNASEKGGYKEIIARIIGRGVYSLLKFESGAHRVQRIPETETQGRIHTSACTIAVLPEADEIDEIEIDNNDLRIDTYRASGAGGQHVNRTDSAVRITHLPTNLVVECQDERSQHKNKARAMSVLRSRLLEAQIREQKNELDQTRRSLVGSGDRSERIRTYNFPQGRVTDHRINLTIYKLDEVLTGELDQVIQPLVAENHAQALATLTIG